MDKTASTMLTNPGNKGGEAPPRPKMTNLSSLGARKPKTTMKRDVLRWEDSSNMKALMSSLRKLRVEDKVAFKNYSNIIRNKDAAPGGGGSKERASPSKVFRPLSEPTAVSKKNINYRIKNKVIKR